MPSDASALNVHVRYSQTAYFAGQEVVCQIAISHDGNKEVSTQSKWGSQAASRVTSRAVSPHRSVAAGQPFPQGSGPGRLPALLERGHRPTLSLGGASPTTSIRSGSGRSSQGHQRSSSILVDRRSPGQQSVRSQRSGLGTPSSRGVLRGHGRSLSMQVGSRGSSSLGTPTFGAEAQTSPRDSHQGVSPSPKRPQSNLSSTMTSSGDAGTWAMASARSPSISDRSSIMSDLTSDAMSDVQSSYSDVVDDRDVLGIMTPSGGGEQSQVNGSARERHSAIVRLMPRHNFHADSSRPSIDLYSTSNHSTETLASEGRAPDAIRRTKLGHQRMSSAATIKPRQGRREHILMGYASITGTFELDGALADSSSYEYLKASGIVGGAAGGGVVGLGSQKSSSGILGGFGWSRISESLNGFLGASEPCTLREMSSNVSTPGFPVLSTPQSLLFVDKTLEPGQQQSYLWRFRLPENLPSTCRGRALKITYNLVIGIQRSTPAGHQHVDKVRVPIRVLALKPNDQQTAAYDLMQPIRLLKDIALTTDIANDPNLLSIKPSALSTTSSHRGSKPATDFFRYARALLAQSNEQDALLSPNASLPPTPSLDSRRSSAFFVTQRDATPLDLSPVSRVLAEKLASDSSTGAPPSPSSTKFTIRRADRFVATVQLNKPCYQIHDTLHLTLDFRDPAVHSDRDPDARSEDGTCSLQSAGSSSLDSMGRLRVLATTFSLLTKETIEPSIALRSTASTDRLTRKVWSEGRVWVVQSSFTSWETVIGGIGKEEIAFPTTITSGASFDWLIRIVFTTEKPQISGLEASLEAGQLSTEGTQGQIADALGNGQVRAAMGDWNTDTIMFRASGLDSEGGELDEIYETEDGSQLETDDFEVSIPVRVLPAEPEVLDFDGDVVLETIGYPI